MMQSQMAWIEYKLNPLIFTNMITQYKNLLFLTVKMLDHDDDECFSFASKIIAELLIISRNKPELGKLRVNLI
jgi:hypothetical protein